MRIALLADLHANAVAFAAVLDALAADPVDQVLCLGDVAATGPQPKPTIALLRDLGCPVVMGNADAELLAPPPATPPLAGDDAARVAAIDRWCAAQLDAADLDFVRTFRPTLTLPRPGRGALVACHGSPRSFDDPIRATTPEEELAPMLIGIAATIVAAGHTHAQMMRRHRGTILLNPGSVGLAVDPMPPASARNVPRAEYAIVTVNEQRLSLDLRTVPFDRDHLLAAAHASGMPHAAWWCADWE